MTASSSDSHGSDIDGPSIHGSYGDRRSGTVLVTGGAGTLGSLVVNRLRDHGHAVRVVSRRG